MPADLTTKENVDALLRGMWLALRDDASEPAKSCVAACVTFAYRLTLLSSEKHELWIRRIETCPGHGDEGGRDWCAYCGKMPKDEPNA